LAVTLFVGLFAGCASIQANKDLNTTPDNRARGDPSNSIKVKEYLRHILDSPEGYEVKAYSRKPYSVNTKKTLFMTHSFYVFSKMGTWNTRLFLQRRLKGLSKTEAGCWTQ
jgi:hypothetical protein